MTHLAGTSSTDAFVRDVVARVAWQRRARVMTRRLWRVAPVAGAAVLLVALIGRMRGWTPALALSVLVAAAVAVVASGRAGRRRRDVPDAVAARIDAEANLGGELRSAYWFASHPPLDAWATFHVDRAAERARAVDWPRLYPAVTAARARMATVALAIATIVLAVSGAWHRAPASSTIAARVIAPAASPRMIALPADVRKHLEDLLAAIERGELSADAARTRTAELRALMSRIDPSLDPALADLVKRTPDGSTVGAGAQGTDAAKLAARAEHAAAQATGLPADVRWSLEDLASRLANSPNDPQPAATSASASAGQPEDAGAAAQAQASALADAAKAGLMMREAASDSAGTQMMMAGAGAAGGDPRSGEGQADLKAAAAGQLLDLERALRRETVEASADAAGSNVVAEAKRKTEQSRATVAFTGAAAPAAFDTSRVASPPPVPEERRALVSGYFLRVPRR